MTLAEARANIGARVAYTGGPRPDYGVIDSVNSVFVFVRYSDGHAEATYPADLVFSVPGDVS